MRERKIEFTVDVAFFNINSAVDIDHAVNAEQVLMSTAMTNPAQKHNRWPCASSRAPYSYCKV